MSTRIETIYICDVCGTESHADYGVHMQIPGWENRKEEYICQLCWPTVQDAIIKKKLEHRKNKG